VFDLRTSDIFNAATLGSARAQRDDIGGSRPAPRPTWYRRCHGALDAAAARPDPERS
jgi:hypothetical protein